LEKQLDINKIYKMKKTYVLQALQFVEIMGLGDRAIFTVKKKYAGHKPETLDDWKKIMKRDKIY